MSIDAELVRSQEFIAQCVQGGRGMSPEEAVDLWRAQNPRADERAENLAAIRQALADLDAGETGVSLEEFDHDFRHRHGLPPGP